MAMAALGMIAAAVVADGAKPVALVDVLQAACQNETNAKTEYLAFATKADEEGNKAAGALSRAAAESESIRRHAGRGRQERKGGHLAGGARVLAPVRARVLGLEPRPPSSGQSAHRRRHRPVAVLWTPGGAVGRVGHLVAERAVLTVGPATSFGPITRECLPLGRVRAIINRFLLPTDNRGSSHGRSDDQSCRLMPL